jgi:hypothetical protein
MTRRKFIAVIDLGAAAMPWFAAVQTHKVRRVGILMLPYATTCWPLPAFPSPSGAALSRFISQASRSAFPDSRLSAGLLTTARPERDRSDSAIL